MQLEDLTQSQLDAMVEHKFNHLRNVRRRAIITENRGDHAFAVGTPVKLIYSRLYEVVNEDTGKRKRVVGWLVQGANNVSGKQTQQTVTDNQIKILKTNKGATSKC